MNLEILNTDDRRLSDEELRYIVEIMAHPKVLAFEPDYRNQQDVDYLFREALKSSRDPARIGRHVSLIAKLDDRPVGFLGIHRQPPPRGHVGDVGMAVHPDHWRQGIGSKLLTTGVELSREIGLTRLEADILANNEGMRRLAEKTGFKLVEVRQNVVDIFGKMEDMTNYVRIV